MTNDNYGFCLSTDQTVDVYIHDTESPATSSSKLATFYDLSICINIARYFFLTCVLLSIIFFGCIRLLFERYPYSSETSLPVYSAMKVLTSPTTCM